MQDYEIRVPEKSKKEFNFRYDSYMMTTEEVEELEKEGY